MATPLTGDGSVIWVERFLRGAFLEGGERFLGTNPLGEARFPPSRPFDPPNKG